MRRLLLLLCLTGAVFVSTGCDEKKPTSPTGGSGTGTVPKGAGPDAPAPAPPPP